MPNNTTKGERKEKEEKKGKWHINRYGECPDNCVGCALIGKGKSRPQEVGNYLRE